MIIASVNVSFLACASPILSIASAKLPAWLPVSANIILSASDDPNSFSRLVLLNFADSVTLSRNPFKPFDFSAVLLKLMPRRSASSAASFDGLMIFENTAFNPVKA